MKLIVKAEHVSKKYRIGTQRAAFSTLRDRVVERARAPFQRLRGTPEPEADDTIWALRDVSFDLKPGEVVGIVGRNGAGKSTLLKILSRVTEPHSGRVEIYGRIGSLLEVGTGFHQELTGRENTFLNGAILGMKKSEIARKFDEIVAFAEVEKFLDTPVKRYSSGMYVRLAFSVAAHLEPDILLIDEVLSVGDMAFQRKCLDKIRQMKTSGGTIIIVSHNMIAVRAICERVLVLSQGSILADGDPDHSVPLYEKLMLEGARSETVVDEAEQGTGKIFVDAVTLLDGEGRRKQSFEIGEKVRVVIEYEAPRKVENVIVYAAIRRPDGFICVASSTKLEGISLLELEGPGVIEVEIPELTVMPGYYIMDITFYDQNFEFRTYFLGRKRVGFQVVSTRLPLDDKYGVFYQKQDWGVNSG